MVYFVRDGKKPEKVDAKSLGTEKLKAIDDPTRMKIMKLLSKKPGYPSQIASELDISKQQAYYHFEKLKEVGLLEKVREEKRSGGLATFYRPVAGGFVVDLEVEGEKLPALGQSSATTDFLSPLVENGELNGLIVVGSPDQHGPDQVRARDGHLATEIGLKLGNYAFSDDIATSLDTEVTRDSRFDENMLLLGGVLTNTVTKKFNDDLPVRFEGEEFPYREIRTPEGSYSEDSIGVIVKAEHSGKEGKSIFVVAGVRNKGTEAAVRAFKNLEDLTGDYSEGDFYAVVRGLDMNGDGKIDDYEVVE
ncbi:MAG: S-layer protein [Candidatus Nanohaloarchaea archaeon]